MESIGTRRCGEAGKNMVLKVMVFAFLFYDFNTWEKNGIFAGVCDQVDLS